MRPKDCKRSSLAVAIGEQDTEAPRQSLKHDINVLGQGDFSHEKLTITMAESPLAESANMSKLSNLGMDPVKCDQYLSGGTHSKPEALLQLDQVVQIVEYLTHKLKTIGAFREVAPSATQSFNDEEDQLREKFIRTCENHDAFLVSKSNASKLGVDAGHAVKEAMERVPNFSEDFLAMKEAIEFVSLGQEMPMEIVARKDVRKLRKASLEGSAKSLQVTKKELDTDLSGYTKVCVCQLLAIIRALKKEIDSVEAVELNHFLEVHWEMGKEGSSLQSLLDSLELKLDAFMRKHVELGGTGLESAKIPICKCNIEAFLPENARAGVLWDRSTGPECKMEQEMTEADIMRSNTCGIVLDVIEKKPRKTIDDAELGLLRTIDEVGTSSKGTATSCVSTCGVEFLSSGEKRGSIKSSVQGSAVSISHIEVDPIYSSIPEFSIRDYVFGARHSDINMNWPFSRRSLQHCLSNGVKNLLPPFQTFDSLRNESTGTFLANSTLPVTNSNMDEKPHHLDNQPILCTFNRESDYQPEPHFSDSNTFPSRDQDIGPKTSTHSQSEIESVSTCDIPIDKESNRFESSASVPLCKSKRSCTLPLKKKRKLTVKLCSNIGSDTAEDVTSASAVTNEAVALKTCPVCANFSSSSNTKLNAHIDQCLSAGSPECMDNNTKCVKPRIKPRKIKLISDIYTTASCCTLEELDRRNGRIPTADSDIGPPLSKVNKGMDQRGLLGHLKESCGDTAVYIDSRGRKVRILSQSVDPSSESKVVEELKPKMMLKRRKRSNLYCSNKKRHFAKGLKYSHFSNQTKKFSSHRPYITKGRAGDKASRTVEGKKLPLKLRGHNMVTDSETDNKRWYSVRTVFSKNHLFKGKRGRPKCKLRSTEELLADNHQFCSHSNSFGNHDENPSSGSAKAHVTSMQSSTKRDTSPGEIVVDQNKGLSNLRNNIASSTQLKGALNSSCESNLASSKLNTIMNGLPEPSDLTEICSSSSGKDTETHPDVAEHSGKSSDANQATRLSISEKTAPSSSQSSFAAFPSIPSSNGSAIEIPNGTNLDKVVACCNKIDQDSDLMQADPEHLCHTSEKIIAGCSLDKLGRKEGVGGLTESSNPNMHKFAEISDTQSNMLGRSKLFFQSEVFAHLNQPCLGDMQSMFYASEVGVGRMDLENEDAEPENGISHLLLDSIPIPGPPGSYLPNFRESCIEDLQGNNSSLTTNWVMSSQETPAMVDHFSDSPFSAASSYLSTIITSDRIISKPDASRAHAPLFPQSICSRIMNEAAEPRMESVLKASDVACVGTEQAALDLDNPKEVGTHEQRESPIYDNDQHQRYFSTKEREHWDASLGLKESQLVGRKAVDAMEEPASDWHVAPWSSGLDNNAETRTGMPSHKHYRTLVSDCPTCSTAKSLTLGGDSGVTNRSFLPPAPPVLRLMGKNLMVINKDEDVTRRPQTAHESQRIKCSSFSVVPRGSYGSPCDLDSDVAPHPIIVPLQQHLNFRSPDTSVLGVPVEEHLKLRSWNSFHSSMNLGTPSSHKNITAVEAHGTNLYR